MKKRVRDKRGFTLIELLVVIALMLSILGIAVVSLVGITNKKKESSKELIKEQIETAALEYFNANEFLFSNLKDNVIGTISVGKLVNEDYLNAVTNPVTGKRIGNCTIVVVKRKNNVFTSDVDDESFEKATDNKTGTQLTNVCDSIFVSSDDIQGGKITYYDEDYNKLKGKRFKDLSDNKKLWFNSKHLGENKNLIACSEDEVEVKKSKGDEIEVIKKEGLGYCATIKNGTNEDITYSSIDGSWALTVAERVDTTPPIVSNLKVETENSYIGSKDLSQIKEYKEKFYSFKLTSISGVKSIFTYNEGNANIIRAKQTCHTVPDNKRCFEYDNARNSHDAEDIYVDGKLKMLRLKSYDYNLNYEKINDILPSLEDGGIYLISELDKSNFPKDIFNYYYDFWTNKGMYYDPSSTYHHYEENKRVNNNHTVNGEVRKIKDRYVYYTKQNAVCIVYSNSDPYNNKCVSVLPIYPNSLNVNAAGVLKTIFRTIPWSSSLYSKIYDKIKPSVLTYVNYDRKINGQITKVSFDYKDEISKVYSYGLDKKYVKEKKRDVKYGDLLASYDPYLTETLKKLNNLSEIRNDRELYNHTYSTNKKSALKDNGLNEEYNKEVLNSVEITGDLKKSEDDYTKTKINKNSDSVTLEHIYADGELDGSIDKYNLNIKDNAGNEVTNEADYEKYKNCTYTKWTEYSDGTEEYCEDVCNKYGTLVRKTGKIAYLIDELTGAYCPLGKWPAEERNAGVTEERLENNTYCPWTDCSVTTTKKTTKGNGKVKEYTRKAFKFSEMDNFCSNKSVVSFSNCNSSDSSLNCRPNYPYKRYKFKELECSCTNDNGNITATSKNVTRTTHPDGYSYIFYTSEANCNKKANEGKNDVRQVCQHIVGDYLDFHGVYWNQGSANYWSGEGWYNNNYVHKKSVDAFTSEKKACEWACGKE